MINATTGCYQLCGREEEIWKNRWKKIERKGRRRKKIFKKNSEKLEERRRGSRKERKRAVKERKRGRGKIENIK